MFSFFKKDDDKKADTVTTTVDSQEQKSEPKKREMIWVEGYKGVHSDLSAEYGDMVYTLNEVYSISEEPVLCERGFHFSLKLDDVFNYYPINFSNRFFKVRALVDKELYDRYGNTACVKMDWRYKLIDSLDKLVAQQIQLLEEVPMDELLSYIQPSFPFIETIEEYKSLTSEEDYKRLASYKFFEELEGKYSKLFNQVVYNQVGYDGLHATMMKMLAFHEQGVSADVSAYLLLKDV